MRKFLNTEIDVATTFIEVAKAASDPESRQWKIRQAQVACETVAKMMNRVPLSAADAELLSNRLAVLTNAIQRLSERS